MGLSDSIKQAVGSAFDALGDLVKVDLVYRRIEPGNYVPSIGTSLDEQTDTIFSGVILSYEDEQVDGDKIRIRDKKIIFQQSELTFTPNFADRIIYGGEDYSILHIKPDPAEATWTLQVRADD